MVQRALRRRLRLTAGLLVLMVAAACTLPSSTRQGGSEQVVSGPPAVQIVAPLPNATYLEGVAVTIQATISNAGANIERVEMLVDGAIVATFPSPNPSGASVFSLNQSWPITSLGQHTVGVTAFRGDGSSSAPTMVNISIVSQPGQQPTATPTLSTQPTQAQATQPTQQQVQPSATPTTPPPPSATSNKPMGKTSVGVNVRSGPGIVFNPPIGSLGANADVELLGINPSGDWYKVRYYNAEAWIYGPNLTVSGDTSQLPVDPGPPTPPPTIPPPPTVTPLPPSNVNFAITSASISPHPFVCAQDSKITVVIINNGTGPSPDGGEILIQDILVSSGQVLEQTNGAFPPLQPGQSFTASNIFLRVNTNYLLEHRTVITIDSTNKVAETNEGDNQNISNYVLAKGNCP